jgi:hypothetical protein
MAFLVSGEAAGCWVATMKLHDGAIPEHLIFSPDGKHLAALVRGPSGYILPPDENGRATVRAHSVHAILMFDTDQFPKKHLTREDNFEPFMPAMEVTIPLESFGLCEPARIVLSQDARKLAVSTTLHDNIAFLQLYMRTEVGWQVEGKCPVTVFPHNDSTTWHGRGITGLELYFLNL